MAHGVGIENLPETIRKSDSNEVIVIDDNNSVSDEGAPKGNVSLFDNSSSRSKSGTFNSTGRSEDVSTLCNASHEIFGIKDTLLADLKNLSKNWPKNQTHDVACQSNAL